MPAPCPAHLPVFLCNHNDPSLCSAGKVTGLTYRVYMDAGAATDNTAGDNDMAMQVCVYVCVRGGRSMYVCAPLYVQRQGMNPVPQPPANTDKQWIDNAYYFENFKVCMYLLCVHVCMHASMTG